MWVGILFLAGSAFLLYALVQEEDYLGPKTALIEENAVLIGVPALAGSAVVATAVKRSRKRPIV